MKSIKDSPALSMLNNLHTDLYEIFYQSSKHSRIINEKELVSALHKLKCIMEELEAIGFEYGR